MHLIVIIIITLVTTSAGSIIAWEHLYQGEDHSLNYIEITPQTTLNSKLLSKFQFILIFELRFSHTNSIECKT